MDASRTRWTVRLLPRMLALAALASGADVVSAREPADAATPSISFGLELVEALDRRDTIRWSATPVPERPALRRRVARVLRNELAAKYPPDFLAGELEGVHVVQDLEGGGRRWGGLHWRGQVVVTLGPDAYLRDALHHELAGLLLERHGEAFPWEAWRAIGAAPAFEADEYSYLPEAADGQRPAPPRLEELTDERASRGWLSSYAETTEANDVEECVRLFFTRPGRVLQLASRHEIVRRKIELATGFLRTISGGRMDREFHRAWMLRSGDPILRREPGLLDLLDEAPTGRIPSERP